MPWGIGAWIGGEGGIRTHGWCDPSTDFESAAIDHSATSPVMGERVDFTSFGILDRYPPAANPTLRIPYWTPDAAPRDEMLLDAIRKRRGGKFINLDLALLWSEPLARGWNAHLGAVRREFEIDPRLKELAICTVARLTGADY